MFKFLKKFIDSCVPPSPPNIDFEKREREIIRRVVAPLAYGITEEDLEKRRKELKGYKFSK